MHLRCIKIKIHHTKDALHQRFCYHQICEYPKDTFLCWQSCTDSTWTAPHARFWSKMAQQCSKNAPNNERETNYRHVLIPMRHIFCVVSYITSEQPQGSKIGHHPKILFPPHYAFLSVSNKPSLTAHRPFGPARCTRRLEIIIISLTDHQVAPHALAGNLATRWRHMQ